MPRIFDNIDQDLLPALRTSMESATRADFCVGYFNLRGWGQLAPYVDPWNGSDESRVRLIVGMQGRPEDDLFRRLSLRPGRDQGIDQSQLVILKRRCAEEFRRQLMFGAPTDADERNLRMLSQQMKDGKLVVKLFLRHTLHAKLYLTFHDEKRHPIDAFLGSSNLTFAGLSMQGELNAGVDDYDACQKLAAWFEDRWEDRWCIDITADLIAVIDESWASEKLLTPYEIYLKMAYHLAQDARAGLTEFQLPKDLADKLFEFQSAAVRIAAHHLNKRGGVLLGDVVGLGKTLMATALARIFQDDQALDTLILCPKNLVPMWERYVGDYRLLATIIPFSMVTKELRKERRHRLVIIDESHNLRNREGKRYKAIRDYVAANESRCILLSATPYNKSYIDLSAQLGLFIDETRDLGIRPERYLQTLGGDAMFNQKHQVPIRSLAAFEHSGFADDWRDLMRLYMVRRTRSFILDNYTETDPGTGRRFLRMKGNQRNYFPSRIPRTVPYGNDADGNDPYQRLYSDQVVALINGLALPRYGLGGYVAPDAKRDADNDEKKVLDNLSRAGKRLMGFCRTNLFKRLESSGWSFLQSLDRHILRNYVFLYALENGLNIPIGVLDAEFFDLDAEDEDDALLVSGAEGEPDVITGELSDSAPYLARATQVYELFRTKYEKRFKWLRPELFTPRLKQSLQDDVTALLEVLKLAGVWEPEADSKLGALLELLERHRNEKVLIFSQFADTVRYLYTQLETQEVERLAMVTGNAEDPAEIVQRFSPVSNRATVTPADTLNVLLATDVLSEGQNLQDCHVIVNYDLPWAIIRLVQRAGRVDRIGQDAETIPCYSFLPAEGVEQIIRLRARVRQRLAENIEVVGSDERFFEDEATPQQLRDLYTEKSGILDLEGESETDLASRAYQIWLNGIKDNPELEKKIAGLPDVVYSTRHYEGSQQYPEGVLVYMKTADGTDSLGWINQNGESVTQSQIQILRAAACDPDTPPIERQPNHHELVARGVEFMATESQSAQGKLGRPSGARYKAFYRLSQHIRYLEKTEPLFVSDNLKQAAQDIYDYPLRATAADTIQRQLRSGINDEDFVKVILLLRSEDRLVIVEQNDIDDASEPHILCSLGLFNPV